MSNKGVSGRKRLILAAFLGAALAAPASASANITSLDPSVQPGSSTTVAQAIIAVPSTLTSATSTEWANGGSGAASPMGVGSTTGSPTTLGGFPTDGTTYGILSSGFVNSIASLPPDSVDEHTDDFASQTSTATDRGQAEDYTVLSMVLAVPGGANCLALDYRFLSEEYPNYVGSEFNDAFIAELDGTSWNVDSAGNLTRPLDFAASPAGNPVSVNGAGPTAMSPSESSDTYFNAATGLVTTKTPITAGAHTVRLSIFDANDSNLDSAVFLDRLRLINESSATCQPPLGLAPPAGGGAPSNDFSLGSSVVLKAKNGQGTITFNLPGAGTVNLSNGSGGSASSAVARESKKKKKKKTALVAPTSATA